MKDGVQDEGRDDKIHDVNQLWSGFRSMQQATTIGEYE